MRCFVLGLLSSIHHRHVPCISDDEKLPSEAEGYVRVREGTLELTGIHGELCFYKTSKEEWKEWLRRNGASDIYWRQIIFWQMIR